MYLKQIIFLFLLLFPCFAWAQNNEYNTLAKKADSLLYVNPKKGLEYALEAHQQLTPKDENYIASVLLLARLQRESREVREAIKTNERGLKLKITVDEQIQFLNELSINHFLLGQQDKRFVYLYKAWTLAKEFGLESKHAGLINSLANHYTNQLNWDSANYYFNQLAPIAHSNGNKLLGDYHFARADNFTRQNQYDTARYHYLAAIDTYELIKLPIKAADVRRSLSILESVRDQYSEALAQLELSEKVYKRLNIDAKLANAYNHRAYIYRRTLRSEESFFYYNKALQIFRNRKVNRDEAIALMNISGLFEENLNQPKTALAYVDSALTVLRPTNYSIFYNKALQQKARVLYDNQAYSLALEPLKEAYAFYYARKDTMQLVENLIVKAQCNNKLGNHLIAQKDLLQVNDMIPSIEHMSFIVRFYEAYLENQIELGNKDGANYALEQLLASQKALAIEIQQRQVSDLQVAYETAKKDEQLATEKARTKTMQLVIDEQNKVTKLILLSGSILLLALVTVVYFLRRLGVKNKQITQLNDKLETQNLELKETNIALKDKNEEINILNETLENSNQNLKEKKDHIEQLHHEMNHRIKNNLQSLSATFFLQMDELEGVAKSVLIEAQNRVNAMGLLHKSLYHDEQNPAFINLPYFVEELLESIESTYDLEIPIEKKLEIEVDKLATSFGVEICLMLNEIVNNSIKYAFPDHNAPAIHIKIYNTSARLHIEVQDNGPGLPANFALAKSKSLGMKLIHRFVRLHHGSSEIKNDNGVRYSISFPLKKSTKSA